MNKLSGAKLAGGNPQNERVQYDYYATNPKAVRMLLEKYPIKGKKVLEPCVGGGHIANELKDFDVTCLDIVDRGYHDTIVTDFLKWETNEKFDAIVTNPPYSLGKEFVERGMDLLIDGGQMAMFLKIQFLEAEFKASMYEKYPPKYIYIFRNRMATWNNGNERDPKTGKKWATTFCHAWFVWEKGNKDEPVVRWL